MNKKILGALLPLSFLWGFDVSLFEEEYKRSFWNGERKIDKTPLYMEAINTLTKSKVQERLNSKKFGEKEFVIPDFKRAYELFVESAKKEKNLASMFLALKISKHVSLQLADRLGNDKTSSKRKEVDLALSNRLLGNKNCYGAIVFFHLKKENPSTGILREMKKCGMNYQGAIIELEREKNASKNKESGNESH